MFNILEAVLTVAALPYRYFWTRKEHQYRGSFGEVIRFTAIASITIQILAGLTMAFIIVYYIYR